MSIAGCVVAAACSPDHTPHAALEDQGTASVPAGKGAAVPPPNAGIDPTLTWAGYAEGSTEASSVSLAAYQDPDGKKGINALVITEVSFSCTACTTETHDIATNMAGPWKDLGVRVIQLVIDDASGHLGKATLDSATTWRTATATTWAVGADPAFSFSHEGNNPMPQVLVVNPRDLSIVSRIEGYDPAETSLDVTTLAHANGAK